MTGIVPPTLDIGQDVNVAKVIGELQAFNSVLFKLLLCERNSFFILYLVINVVHIRGIVTCSN